MDPVCLSSRSIIISFLSHPLLRLKGFRPPAALLSEEGFLLVIVMFLWFEFCLRACRRPKWVDEWPAGGPGGLGAEEPDCFFLSNGLGRKWFL